jgi:prepilin-type processing-associated H-X9-DG protein
MNDMAARTVIWGCPKWRGVREPSYNAIETPYSDGLVSAFEVGYTYNPYPFYNRRWPINDTEPAHHYAMNADTYQFRGVGNPPERRYKFTEYTQPSERALVVEGTFWVMGFVPAAGHKLIGQSIYLRNWENSQEGTNNFDYYRHGRPPRVSGTRFDAPNGNPGGRVRTNILYCDGHAETVSDPKLAYRSIRMQLP